ncbi:hypothetical protein [Motiliproteus coralliicola]|nr:hypothetical protein [Motiliproteus coralliicola]
MDVQQEPLPEESQTFSAWNPGIEPDLPAELLPLETIHRAENVTSCLAEVVELAEWTGIPMQELVVFRPERLALHELIVRINADVVVQEAIEEEDLGKHFRNIVSEVMDNYIQPREDEIVEAYQELRTRASEAVLGVLDTSLFASDEPEAPSRSLLDRYFRRRDRRPHRIESTLEKTYRVLRQYKESGLKAQDPFLAAIYKALYKVLGTIAVSRGYIGVEKSLLAKLVTDRVCNLYGSQIVGQIIAPAVRDAIDREGYTRSKVAEKPIVISLKGASAAGKSSLRPMLTKMIGQLGIAMDGYTTISPDIWRRLLLDYSSLGANYKYAGRLTSHEVSAVDTKLDQYIRDKALVDGSIPHLLLDRFRFDSFSSEKIGRILLDTYLKFADTMYLYFVVTPPEATVERGWERGLNRGRYKAVEDFLGHSVEAYEGMPRILFKWLAHDKPKLKYQFLDNSVPKGTFPKTIAYGDRETLTIVDLPAFLNIERYQKINVSAKSPEAVYLDSRAQVDGYSVKLLKRCLSAIPKVDFLDEATGQVFLRAENGVLKVRDRSRLTGLAQNSILGDVLSELDPKIVPTSSARQKQDL